MLPVSLDLARFNRALALFNRVLAVLLIESKAKSLEQMCCNTILGGLVVVILDPPGPPSSRSV